MRIRWWLIVLLVLFVLVSGVFFLFYIFNAQFHGRTPDVGPDINYCESVDDCVIINQDCSGCSCDFIFINKDYADDVCNGVEPGGQCEDVCDLRVMDFSLGCFGNKCGS